MTRLNNLALPLLPDGIGRPGYDRSAVADGVVHFGPGAFHRAHQAAAFDTVLHRDLRWGIVGISLNSTGVADALNPQDGLYTLALLDAEREMKVIGSIRRILTAGQPDAILEALASADTRLITMTVTEKGYCIDGRGELDLDHPAIRADLAAEGAPQSVIGWLARGLAARRMRGLPGLTILSCDNLTDNGRKLGRAVQAFAAQSDPDLAGWIADNVRFPNAMVDSITPATDDALRRTVAGEIGFEDAWPIQRERFSQWIIEDDFAGERPPLDHAGVIFTKDVHPYEAAKLRLLNGAHSTLAYLGIERGYGTVAQAMADGDLAGFVGSLMRHDIAPTLTAPEGFDVDRYIDAILKRFENPAIEHHLSQIAWDGSQKLPYRLLGTIRDTMAAARSIDRLAVPVAAWLRFIAAASARGGTIVDPMAATLLAHGADWRSIVAIDAIFGDLGDAAEFLQAIDSAMVANTPARAMSL